MESCPICLAPRMGDTCSRCSFFLGPLGKHNEWSGQTNGKLLIVAPNSFGDLFERSRHLNVLTERGVDWVLMLDPRAIDLMATAYPKQRLTPYGQYPEFDLWTNLIDGLKCFSVGRPEHPQFQIPESGIEFPKPVIGICFYAAEKYEPTKMRSIGKEAAQTIVNSVHNVNWVNLQYGETLEAPCLNPELNSWMDTAQIVSKLDAVVSIDTAIPHLAAILKVPTAILFGMAPTSVVEYRDFQELYRGSPIKHIYPTYGGFGGGRFAWQNFIEWANQTPEWWKRV